VPSAVGRGSTERGGHELGLTLSEAIEVRLGEKWPEVAVVENALVELFDGKLDRAHSPQSFVQGLARVLCAWHAHLRFSYRLSVFFGRAPRLACPCPEQLRALGSVYSRDHPLRGQHHQEPTAHLVNAADDLPLRAPQVVRWRFVRILVHFEHVTDLVDEQT